MRCHAINAGSVEKHGVSLPKRHGAALRSQSGEVAGLVVRGLEAPGAHPSGGAAGSGEVRNAGAVRARLVMQPYRTFPYIYIILYRLH